MGEKKFAPALHPNCRQSLPAMLTSPPLPPETSVGATVGVWVLDGVLVLVPVLVRVGEDVLDGRRVDVNVLVLVGVRVAVAVLDGSLVLVKVRSGIHPAGHDCPQAAVWIDMVSTNKASIFIAPSYQTRRCESNLTGRSQ